MAAKGPFSNLIGVAVGLGLISATYFSVMGAALLANRGWNENIGGGSLAVTLPLLTLALIIASVLSMAAGQTRRALVLCVVSNALPFVIAYGVLWVWRH